MAQRDLREQLLEAFETQARRGLLTTPTHPIARELHYARLGCMFIQLQQLWPERTEREKQGLLVLLRTAEGCFTAAYVSRDRDRHRRQTIETTIPLAATDILARRPC
jgi:hypothetical protein